MKMAIVVLQPCQKRYIWKQTEIMACNNSWWQKMLFTSHALMKYCFRTVETNYREEQPCNLNHLWKLSNCFTLCVWNFIFISTKHQWIWHSSTRACTKVCVMVVVCVQNIISYQVQSVSVEKLIKGYSQYLKVPAHHFIVLQAYDEHVKSCVLVYAFGFLSRKKIMLGSVVKKSFDCKESK